MTYEALDTGSCGNYSVRNIPKNTEVTWLGNVLPFLPKYMDDAESHFKILADKWTKDTLDMSLLAEIVAHPAYLQIIAMNWRAVPFMLRELNKKPAHWFVALNVITGENPVPHEAVGRVDKMAEAWLEWGYKEGMI